MSGNILAGSTAGTPAAAGPVVAPGAFAASGDPSGAGAPAPQQQHADGALPAPERDEAADPGQTGDRGDTPQGSEAGAAGNGEAAADKQQPQPERTFKQAEVNDIVQRRVMRLNDRIGDLEQRLGESEANLTATRQWFDDLREYAQATGDPVLAAAMQHPLISGREFAAEEIANPVAHADFMRRVGARQTEGAQKAAARQAQLVDQAKKLFVDMESEADRLRKDPRFEKFLDEDRVDAVWNYIEAEAREAATARRLPRTRTFLQAVRAVYGDDYDKLISEASAMSTRDAISKQPRQLATGRAGAAGAPVDTSRMSTTEIAHLVTSGRLSP